MIAAIEIPNGYNSPEAPQRRHRQIRPPLPHLRSHLGEDRLRPARAQPPGQLRRPHGRRADRDHPAPHPRPGAQHHPPHRHLPPPARRLAQGHRHRETLRRPLRAPPRPLHHRRRKGAERVPRPRARAGLPRLHRLRRQDRKRRRAQQGPDHHLHPHRRPLRQVHGPAADGPPARPRQRGPPRSIASRVTSPSTSTKPCSRPTTSPSSCPPATPSTRCPTRSSSTSASPPTRAPAKLHDNILHYTRTYTVRQVSLPADRYADVQKLAGVIAADEQSTAVLKKQ